MKEVIKTTGDVRRLLAQTMQDIASGELATDRGMAIASLSKELTASMQIEINVVKVRLQALETGKSIGEVKHLGQLLIDGDSIPTLSGKE